MEASSEGEGGDLNAVGFKHFSGSDYPFGMFFSFISKETANLIMAVSL